MSRRRHRRGYQLPLMTVNCVPTLREIASLRLRSPETGGGRKGRRMSEGRWKISPNKYIKTFSIAKAK